MSWNHRVGLALGVVLAACGGGTGDGGNAADTAAMGSASMTSTTMSMPAWMQVDRTARTVSLDITAAQTPVNNGWNFNGHFGGDATITVPAGYTVTIHFSNQDQALAHSIGVSNQVGDYPAMFDNPQPAFEGGISSDPTNPEGATRPRGTATVTFTAANAGSYSLVCYIPAHATAGMWVRFNVDPGDQAGVSMP